MRDGLTAVGGLLSVLADGDIAEVDGETFVCRIDVGVQPLVERLRVVLLKVDGQAGVGGLAVHPGEYLVLDLRIHLTHQLADLVLRADAQHAGAALAEVGVTPVLVEHAEAIGHAVQHTFQPNIGEEGSGFATCEGLLGEFGLRNVAEVDRKPFRRGVAVVLDPFIPRVRLVLDDMSRLAGVNRLVARAAECAVLRCGEDIPDAEAEHAFGAHTQHARAAFIQVRKAPVPVQDAEAVRHAGQHAFERLVDMMGGVLGTGEGLFTLFALRYVAQIDGETFIGGVVVVLQPLVDVSVQELLKVDGLAGGDGTLGLLGDLGLLCSGKDLPVGLADDGLAVDTEDLCSALAHVGIAALFVTKRKAIRHTGEHAFQPLVGQAGVGLGSQPIRDVGVHADPFEDVAGSVSGGDGADLHGAVDAIAPADALPAVECGAGRHRELPCGIAGSEVVRMNGV